MKTYIRDDTVHDVEYVTRREAEEEIEAEKSRADQLWLNITWLVDKIDRIHEVLCPGQNGTWQQRAEQAVKAAKSLRL